MQGMYRREIQKAAMKLIILAGLVSVEKGQLALELANHFIKQNRRVAIIDNIARLPIDMDHLNLTRKIRLDGTVLGAFHEIIEIVISCDISLLAISETMNPVNLSEFIGNIYERINDIDITTAAMIDTRTCDCFPTLREMLERNADIIVTIPYDLSELVNTL